ncbi:MAG: hypothetical protein JSR98_17785 [Proteobacteria bacterium]|nr:hypothetical protein [Pseudomonadota bacterium]
MSPGLCKLGLVLPAADHARMTLLAQRSGQGRGALQMIYEAAFEALLAALAAGDAVLFPAVRGPKIRVTLRLPIDLCLRIRAAAARLTLKLTDFACAAVGRALEGA